MIIAGIKKWCSILRFCCRVCGKTFTLLPAYLLPFKQYTVQEIEGALRHLYEGGQLAKAPTSAEESTLRRWRREFSYKLQQWAGSLESRIYDLCGQTPNPLLSHPFKRLERILSELSALPSRWAVITKTIWWFNSSHPLCLS